VTLTRREEVLAMPVIRAGLSPGERLAQLRTVSEDDPPDDVAGWLTELVADRDDQWRSPWLRACALYAATQSVVTVDVGLDELRALGDPDLDELIATVEAASGQH
jgi:hypothetical protein